MLKQSSSMKKGLAILLVVLFVVSLTAVAASAYRIHGSGHGHYGGHGRYGGYGGYGGWGYGSYGGWGYGAGCYIVNGALVCPTYGYPYI